MASADLERLLEPDYLGDLQSRSIEEIRAMREECRHAIGVRFLSVLVFSL